MSDDIESRVTKIICEQLDKQPADISLEKSFTDDLGADSLALVELVLAFEEEFGVKIPDDQTQNIRTVQDAVSYIKQNAG